tara:strand:+ start:228 stop:890 length:663 start_codon:yes stop_codon:yes gene_type:complete
MTKSTTSKTSAKGASKKAQKSNTIKKTVKKEAGDKPVTIKASVKQAVNDSKKKVEDSTPKEKRVVDKDSILSDFDTLLGSIDTNIASVRECKIKSPVTIKDLRALSKQVRQLRMDVNRQIRKKRTNTTTNVNSGFMKAVQVSDAMCAFAKWKKDELHSRVDVTKSICAYIKDHNLQNPEDRRQILADAKLKKLLNLSNSKEPLTYYSLQRHIQQHFVGSK